MRECYDTYPIDMEGKVWMIGIDTEGGNWGTLDKT